MKPTFDQEERKERFGELLRKNRALMNFREDVEDSRGEFFSSSWF